MNAMNGTGRIAERVRAAVGEGGTLGVGGFARGVTMTLATRVAGIVFGIVTLTLTTRWLGVRGRGEFAVTMASLALVVQFSNLGLHAAATYTLSREPERRREIIAFLAWFCLVPVGALCALTALAGTLFPGFLRDVTPSLLAIAMAAGPPSLFLLLAANAYLGLGRPGAYNLVDLFGKVAGLLAVLVLLAGTLVMLFWTYTALYYAIAIGTYLALAGFTVPRLPSRDVTRLMLSFGGRVFIVSFLMFLVLRIDLFLVNSMLGTEAAGHYSVAVQVAELLSLASASVSAILFPRLSSMAAADRWAFTLTVVRASAVLLGGSAIVLGLISRPVFLYWFGPEYLPSVDALLWLLPGLWCLGLNSMLHQLLASYGMPWFVVLNTGGGAVFNVLLNLVLVPRFGILGAAAASTVTYAALLLATTIYLQSPSGRSYRAA